VLHVEFEVDHFVATFFIDFESTVIIDELLEVLVGLLFSLVNKVL